MRSLAFVSVSLGLGLALAGPGVADRGPAGLRWDPEGGRLALDGAVVLTLTGPSARLADDLAEARAHLRRVRSSELVPLEPMTHGDVDAAGHPVAIYYPVERLRRRTVYVFETRGPSLEVSRVFHTGGSTAPRLRPGPPRFRHLEEGRFTCEDLDLALRVEVEIERNPEAEPTSEDDDMPGAWEGRWQEVGTYLLEPRRQRGGDTVDLGELLGDGDGAYRVRFRLIGWDAFRGRPSRWIVLPARRDRRRD